MCVCSPTGYRKGSEEGTMRMYFSKLIYVINLSDCSVVLRWYKILLGISGTVNGILVLTLITLFLLVSQEVLLKCQKGNNSNITQQDDFEYLKVNSNTRGNISKKDAGHCVSRATDHQAMEPFQRFFIKGPAKENSCAAIKENRIYSETCSSVFKWICQY
eukprot:bmy_05524T0